jgi:hypothetical protein
VTVSCQYKLANDLVGWFNESDGCYYFLMSPQPPTGSALREGHAADDGAVYQTSCFPPDNATTLDYLGVGFVWLASAPPGFEAGPTPAQLAQQALAKIHLRGAVIGTAPDNGIAGLAGLPVWLWTTVTPETWGPNTASATGGAVTVTITARATKIVWSMGDGHAVTCANHGTVYAPSYGDADSPTCGYTYRTSSRGQPDGRYHLTATTTWRVDWSGGGESGVIITTRISQTSMRIDELQVVTG